MQQRYKSDVRLGDKYRDTQTGFEGHATQIAFFQHGCERVGLKAMVEGKIEEFYFDAPELVHVETGERPAVEKTGGPRPMVPRTGVQRS